MPGTKRNNVDFHTVEQEAGRAVLKLLDAKIGKYVTCTFFMEKVKLNHFGIPETLARLVKGVAQCGISKLLCIYPGLKDSPCHLCNRSNFNVPV